MRRAMRILVLLVLLVACRKTVHVNPEPTHIPGILKQGDTVRMDLVPTSADDIEERPFLLLDVVIVDAEMETEPLPNRSWVLPISLCGWKGKDKAKFFKPSMTASKWPSAIYS